MVTMNTSSTPNTSSALPVSRAQAVFTVRGSVARLEHTYQEKQEETNPRRLELSSELDRFTEELSDAVRQCAALAEKHESLGTAMVPHEDSTDALPSFRKMTEEEINTARSPLNEETQSAQGQKELLEAEMSRVQISIEELLGPELKLLEQARANLAELEFEITQPDQAELDELELAALRAEYELLQDINVRTMDKRCGIYDDLVPQVCYSIRKEKRQQLSASEDESKHAEERKETLRTEIDSVYKGLDEFAPDKVLYP